MSASESLWKFLRAALCAAGLIAFLAACGGGVNAYDRANTVCGRGPMRVIEHHGEFASNDWLEVRCRDGSTRAVPNG